MCIDGEKPEALAIGGILPGGEVEPDACTEVDVAIDIGTYGGQEL